MSTSGVNDTSSVNDIYYSGKGEGITTSTAITGKAANEMGMDEFFTLLTAQMTNQDMMNPESNTEFIAQMAQFSALQGVKTIQEYQLSNYAVSYTGKAVTIAAINESTGDIEKIDGVVEKVTFYDGKPQVWINDTAYQLHQIMEVKHPDATETVAGNTLSQVAGYIGQTVTVTDTTDPEFPRDVTGVVTSVTLKGGKPYVIVDGKQYPASAITNVGEVEDYWIDTGLPPDDGTGTDIDDETGTDTDGGTDTDTDIDDETGTGIDTDPDTDTGTGTDYDTDDDYDAENAYTE